MRGAALLVIPFDTDSFVVKSKSNSTLMVCMNIMVKREAVLNRLPC